MAKSQNTNVDLEKINKVNDDLSLDNYLSASDVITDFSKVDTSKLQTLTQEYLQMSENTEYNMIFIGRDVFTGDRGEVNAVVLVDEDGKKWMNGNTVLVNSLSKVVNMPCLVKIVTGKKISGKKGTYLDMEVFVLPNSLKTTSV